MEFLACNFHYLRLKGAFYYTFIVNVFQGFDLCDIHGKRPHNHFRLAVLSKLRILLACNSHYLRLKGAFYNTFIVPVFQGFDFCDIHGKRPHNPFSLEVLSKLRIFLACDSHYLRLDEAF